MSLQTRIRAALLLVVLAMSAAAGVILWNQNQLQESFDLLNTTTRLDDFLMESRRQEKNFLLRKDKASVAAFNASYDSLFFLTNRLAASVETHMLQDTLDRLIDREDRYRSTFNQLVQLTRTKNPSARLAKRIETQIVKFARECHSIIDAIREIASQQFRQTRSTTHMVNIAALVIGILLSVLIAGVLADRAIRGWEQQEGDVG